MKVKEESEKAGLKLSIQKTKIMTSGPITSWQIDGKTMETVTEFIFVGSKITANGDCSHEIKRYLLLGRKAMINLDSILKSRDVTLPTKCHLVKAMIFPVMDGCETWTIKKAEHWIIDAFELWCWRSLLWVPWTARRSRWILAKRLLSRLTSPTKGWLPLSFWPWRSLSIRVQLGRLPWLPEWELCGFFASYLGRLAFSLLLLPSS